MKKYDPPPPMSKASLDSQWDDVLAGSKEPVAASLGTDEPEVAISIRWWLVLASVLVLAASAAGGWWWYAHQVRAHSAMILQQALAAQDQQNWAAAADWLGQYIQYVPEDAERVRQLADRVLEVAKERAEFERALRLYDAYLQMRPQSPDVRLRVAKILLFFNPQRAMDRVDQLLVEDSGNLEALRIKAVALDRLYADDPGSGGATLKRVIDAYRALLAKSPGDTDNAQRMASLCREHAERLAGGAGLSVSELHQLADTAMDRLVATKPRDVQARLARFQYRLAYHPQADAEGKAELDEDLRLVLQQEPDNLAALYAAGVYFADSQPGDLIRRDRLQLAGKYLERAVAQSPVSPDPYLLLARVQAALARGDQAVAVIQSGLKKIPGDLQLLAALADLQIELQRWSQARTTMDRLDEIVRTYRRVPVSPDRHLQLNLCQAQLAVLRARWYLHPDNPDRQVVEANRMVDQAIHSSVPPDQASKVFQDVGVLCARLGRWPDAVEAYYSATAAAPLAVTARLQLITALVRVGRFAEAAAECRQLTDRPLNAQYALELWLQYARLLLELELSKPSSDRLWDDFDKALAHLKRIGGNLPEVQWLELDAQTVRQGPQDAATAQSLRALEAQFGDSTDFWQQALQFYLQWDLPADAQRAATRLEQLVEHQASGAGAGRLPPQTAPPTAGQGDPVSGQPSTESAGTNAQQTAKQFKDQLDQMVQQQRYADAFGVLVDWSQQLPGSVQPRVELSRLVSQLAQAGQYQQLESGLQRVEGPEGTLWRLARVQGLLGQSKSADDQPAQQALKFALSWTEANPDLPAARQALGMVHEARGDYPAAIEVYRQLFERGERRLDLVQKLAGLLLLAGRGEDALKYTRHLGSRQRLGPAQLPLTIQLWIARGELDRAVQDARVAVELQPNTAEAHVWLGCALQARGREGDRANAESAFQRACELAPSDFLVLVAAIHHGMQSGVAADTHALWIRTRRAMALLNVRDCPSSAWQSLVVARCAQLQGSLAVADTFYRKAIAIHPDVQLRGWIPQGAIVTSQTGQVTTDLDDSVVWATGTATYQTLGLLSGALGEPDSPKLRKLLDDDPRLRAVVVLGQGQKGSSETALQLLNQITSAQWSAGDHLLVAEVYAGIGKPADAADHWQAALDAGPSERQLRCIAESALRHGEQAVAGQAIERLKPLDSSDLRVFSLELRRLAAADRGKALVRAAEDTVRQQADVNSRLAWARVAAGVLARSGYLPEARALVEAACRRHPQGNLVFAGWIATQPDLSAEALQTCLELARSGDKQLAAALAAAALQHATGPAELTGPAESLLQEALSQDPSWDLLLEASRLREVQGQIDKAAELARQAQQLSALNPAVDNNLAWYQGVYQKQFEPALQLIDQAIDVAGPVAALLDTKAVILIQSGQRDKALSLLETAVLDDQASASTYLHVAAAYAAAGRPAEARRAFQVAERLGRSDSTPFDRRLAEKLRSLLNKPAP